MEPAPWPPPCAPLFSTSKGVSSAARAPVVFSLPPPADVKQVALSRLPRTPPPPLLLNPPPPPPGAYKQLCVARAPLASQWSSSEFPQLHIETVQAFWVMSTLLLCPCHCSDAPNWLTSSPTHTTNVVSITALLSNPKCVHCA